jgi:hypothetical protein
MFTKILSIAELEELVILVGKLTVPIGLYVFNKFSTLIFLLLFPKKLIFKSPQIMYSVFRVFSRLRIQSSCSKKQSRLPPGALYTQSTITVLTANLILIATISISCSLQ